MLARHRSVERDTDLCAVTVALYLEVRLKWQSLCGRDRMFPSTLNILNVSSVCSLPALVT